MLNELGLDEWTIVESKDPWCSHSRKILYVYKNDNQSLLHEATHALIGGGHPRHFWTLFEGIVDYFLGECLSPYQERMKQDYL